jgi:micrococcal nuclease
MKYYFTIFLALHTSFFAFAQQKQTATVLQIVDGDTFWIDYNGTRTKVRLSGIDCPEHDQEYFQESKEYVMFLVGKEIEFVSHGNDRYGRLLADIYFEDTWINSNLIENGFAWFYREYSNDLQLARAECKARQAKEGLFADPHANYPNCHKKEQFCQPELICNIQQDASSPVFICDSSSSKTYHSKQSCSGLTRCTHETKTMSETDAKHIGKSPCAKCH